MFELIVGGATDDARHSQSRYEETIYEVDGALTWTVDGKPIEICIVHSPGELFIASTI